MLRSEMRRVTNSIDDLPIREQQESSIAALVAEMREVKA